MCVYHAFQMPMSKEEQQQQEEAKEAAEEQRRRMLIALMDAGARERCMCCCTIDGGRRMVPSSRERLGIMICSANAASTLTSENFVFPFVLRFGTMPSKRLIVLQAFCCIFC